MTDKMKLTMVAAVAALVAGCGGGGSSGGGGVTPPPPAAGVPILRTMPANPYTAGTAEFNNFAEINRVRLAGGFGAMNGDPVLDVAASGEINYKLVNYGSTTCINQSDPHGQKVGCPAFTGSTPQARCDAAAKGTDAEGKLMCGEVQGGLTAASLPQFSMVSAYTEAIGHMQVLLDAYANRVGMKMMEFPGSTALIRDYGGVINPGYRSDSMLAPSATERNSILGVFPYDGMTGVGIGSGALCMDGTVSSIGILVQIGINLAPTVTKFALRKDGATVDTPIWQATPGISRICGTEPTAPGGWALMKPQVILDPNTKYTVTFEGTSEGKALSKTWSFTTGTDRFHQVPKQ